MQDYAIDLDEITKIYDDSIFELKALPKRAYEKDTVVLMDITIELDLDRKLIKRMCYSLLELMSDVGGMIGILMVFLSSIVSCFNYNNFDNYMVSRLFKIKKLDSEANLSNQYFQRADFIDPSNYNNFLEYFLSIMPCKKCCCLCCRKSRA